MGNENGSEYYFDLTFIFDYSYMELMQPYAIRSQFDPENDYTNIDYSLVAPLAADGSNYPCKGYHKDLANRHVVAQYTPGNSYEAVMAGSSPHIGGCPCPNGIDCDNGGVSGNMRIPFTIPSDAPAAENILFAWGWHNWEGNREYYMNCAAVDILGDNTSGLGGLPELLLLTLLETNANLIMVQTFTSLIQVMMLLLVKATLKATTQHLLMLKERDVLHMLLHFHQ